MGRGCADLQEPGLFLHFQGCWAFPETFDSKIAAAELSGRVFELKRLEDFSGNYQRVESESAASGAGTRAAMKNQTGVIVNLVSTVEGRKFTLAREGMDIELKK